MGVALEEDRGLLNMQMRSRFFSEAIRRLKAKGRTDGLRCVAIANRFAILMCKKNGGW